MPRHLSFASARQPHPWRSRAFAHCLLAWTLVSTPLSADPDANQTGFGDSGGFTLDTGGNNTTDTIGFGDSGGFTLNTQDSTGSGVDFANTGFGDSGGFALDTSNGSATSLDTNQTGFGDSGGFTLDTGGNNTTNTIGFADSGGFTLNTQDTGSSIDLANTGFGDSGGFLLDTQDGSANSSGGSPPDLNASISGVVTHVGNVPGPVIVWVFDAFGNKIRELTLANGPGAFSVNLPIGHAYDLKAFRDGNQNGSLDPSIGEPYAHHGDWNASTSSFNLLQIDGNLSGIDIAITWENDADSDGFSDWEEHQAGTNINNASSFPIYNSPPTDINSSAPFAVGENQSVGTFVGDFNATDPDTNASHLFALADGNGSTHNNLFTLDANGTLKTAASFDHEANASLSIRVKATDEHNASFEKVFPITVTNVVEDIDGDGIENHLDPDDDNDGYSDAEEIAASSNSLSAFSLPPVGKVIYVDDNASGANSGESWANAFTSLQSALTEASGSVRTEIWVAEGVYRPDIGPGQTFNSRASTFQLKNRVELHGGFMGNEATPDDRTGQNEWATVLTGDLGGQNWHDDNAYHVVTASGVDRTAVLSNFRIEHGRASGPGEWDKRGAGILADNGSPRLSFLYFYGNVSYGANSGGGGLCVYNSGSPAIFSCIFIGNYAEWGGAVKLSMGSSAALYNVLMVKNQAVKGGALVAWDSNASVIHSTIVDNNATTGGGLYLGSGAIVSMANSIIWDNNATTAKNLHKDGSSYVDFNHTMVKEVNDTASADEFFFDPERFDYRLRNGSPLINAGNPLSAGIMPMDLHGLPRNQDAAPDIGVYEGGLDVVDLGGQVTYSGIVDSGPFRVWLNDENENRLKELEMAAPALTPSLSSAAKNTT